MASMRKLQHMRFVSNVEKSYYKYMNKAYEVESKMNKADSFMVDM